MPSQVVPFAKPIMGNPEIRAVVAALNQDRLTNGAFVQGFEQDFADFCGGGQAVAVSSCMAGLHTVALCLLKPGDEVIVPALTHPATALAVSLVGAIPRFVDVDRKTGNVTPEAIEAAIGPKTIAVFLVHYLSRPCDMAAITGIARNKGLLVIEDCALALGSMYGDRHVGLWGEAGVFSFYPAKHITTGEGGMILSKHPNLIDATIKVRHFGQDHGRGLGLMAPLQKFTRLGLNYRMTEMQGALGRMQIRRMESFLAQRKINFNTLSEAFGDLEQIESGGYSHYGLSCFIPKRDKFRKRLKRRDVEVSVYYPTPVPLTDYYREQGYRPGQFPNAEAIANGTVCFPVGPHIGPEELKKIIKVTRESL